jgi:16S rRNA (uracil1498-N3)-methyltransferase
MLFPGYHSERKKFTEDQHLRMLQVAISAMKQCGRLDLPVIECIGGLKELKGFGGNNAYFGDVSAAAPLLINEWQKSPPKQGAIFFIGPETGFSEEEEGILKKLGAKGIKLHGNILRTETASLATLAIASQLLINDAI